MTDRDDLLALAALDLLDPDEQRHFNDALARDPALHTELADLRLAAAALAATAPQVPPPPSLRAKVMAEIQSLAPAKSSVTHGSHWAMRAIPWAVAAALAVACVVTWQQRDALASELTTLARVKSQLEEEITGLRAERDAARVRLASLEKRDPLAGIQVAALAPQDAQFTSSQAAAAWDQSAQKGVLHIANLPPAQPGKDYQLWVVDPAQKHPVDSGVIASTGNPQSIEFKPNSPVSTAAAFAISLEPAGGSAVARGPIILVGKL